MNALAEPPSEHAEPIADTHPKRKALPQTFTKANAVEMSKRGWAKRRLAAQQTEILAAKGREVSPECEKISRAMNGILERIQKERSADRLGKLVGAAGRLFKMWQVLAGVPNPGSRRGKQRGPITANQVEPLAGGLPEPLPEEPKSGADCPK